MCMHLYCAHQGHFVLPLNNSNFIRKCNISMNLSLSAVDQNHGQHLSANLCDILVDYAEILFILLFHFVLTDIKDMVENV